MDLFKKSVIVVIFLCAQQMNAAVTIAEKNRAMLLQGYLSSLALRSQHKPLSNLERKSVESVLTQLKKTEEKDPELHLVEDVQSFVSSMKYAAPAQETTETKTETQSEEEQEIKEGPKTGTEVQQLSIEEQQKQIHAVQKATVLRYIDSLKYDQDFKIPGYIWGPPLVVKSNWLNGLIKVCKQNAVSNETIDTNFVLTELKKKIVELGQKQKFNAEEVFKHSIEKLKKKIAQEKASSQQQGVSGEKPEEFKPENLTPEQQVVKTALNNIAEYIQQLTQQKLITYKVNDLEIQRFDDSALIPIMLFYNNSGMRLEALYVQKLLHAVVKTYGLAETSLEIIVDRSVNRLGQMQEIVNYINALTGNDFAPVIVGLSLPKNVWFEELIQRCKAQKITIGGDFIFDVLSKKIALIAQEKKVDPKKLVDASIERLQKLMQKTGVPVGTQQAQLPKAQVQQQVVPPIAQEVIAYINALTEKNFILAIMGANSYLKNNWLEGLAEMCKKNSIRSDNPFIFQALNEKVIKIAEEKKLNVKETMPRAITKLKQLMSKPAEQQQVVEPPKEQVQQQAQPPVEKAEQQQQIVPPKEQEQQQAQPPAEQAEQQEVKPEVLSQVQKLKKVREYIGTLDEKNIIPDEPGISGQPVHVDPQWIEGLVAICKKNDVGINNFNVYVQLEERLTMEARKKNLPLRRIKPLLDRTRTSIEDFKEK